MDLTPYVDSLSQALGVAAEAGGPEARVLAERLAAPLESATRLALLEALSAAAAEITRDLAPGSVDLRLRGREPSFVVTAPPVDDVSEVPVARSAGAPPPAAPASGDGEEGSTARINLRLGEQLKGRIEEAAGQAGLSVNAWLVRVAAAALDPDEHVLRSGRSAPRGSQGFVGWVR